MGLLKQFMQLVFTFLLLASEREIEVKAGSFPLPDILDSPHIKNQSVVYCGDEFDPTFLVNFLPKKYDCTQRGTMVIRFTPKVDVFSLVCYGKLYVNRDLMMNKVVSDLCSRREDIKCPLLKGETQQLEAGLRIPCIVSEAHYHVQVYCTNEDDVTVSCFDWSFTWV